MVILILEAMEQMMHIKGCIEGIHTAQVSSLHRWFPDVDTAIVLYIDNAISTDTLNMRQAGTGIKWNRW